jgi:hypothetical protein
MDGQGNIPETMAPPPKQHLLRDGLRRMSTHSPVMMLPRLIMTQHLFASMARSRKRLADGHRYQMRLLGETVKDDDDGNISLQGDTVINNHGSRWLPGLLLTAGMAAAGYCAWQLYHGPQESAAASAADAPPASAPPFDAPEPVAVPPYEPPAAGCAVQDWKLGVVVTDAP